MTPVESEQMAEGLCRPVKHTSFLFSKNSCFQKIVVSKIELGYLSAQAFLT